MIRNVMVLIFWVACVAGSPAYSETLKDVRATETLSKTVADLIAVGRIDDAYGHLRTYWPIPKHEIDTLIYTVKWQRPAIAARFGKSLSMERAGTQVLGDSFVRYVFLEKYERHAIAWAFTFYRPRDSWVVNSAIYTDEFSAMFEWLPGAPGSPKEKAQEARMPPNKGLQLTATRSFSLTLVLWGKLLGCFFDHHGHGRS